ncbi:ATP phosphoribosyltransferase [Clostridium botulinum]|uniref:ATP phosphoribosyltransferase n=1 Tax=Clostridium botulinum (strain Okra / Type B1) TaxID=498213 RepID=HIS1_CLOBK|nr:ATP phosphoribosyltransferase [Clostridium botulinum]B1ILA4.1 RecName: Full=ATP phosphoribosyltransferase; Short=ATP-PRT; Short=ATP-PRTase [Clostridium botulinum B1 str. Okra]ACA46891.1 ATP phosphoribosyltransferase [Clostridium botulinum B1 str. Okra]APQ96414.1 ATP phosphoribosyltransferase [Clostridium botulinum]KEI75720.1 ATP phosphoribosyltransferase [Clostridium botulinum B2 128]KEI89477.1 ATP phosphoribosyltransferase [Clostridium botulinum B2 433]MBD5573789.1 ATP phosphoribosyltrans
MKNVKIALTKGRLEKKAIEIFKTININTRELEDKGRKLIFNCENEEYNIELFLVKAKDVETYVEYGAADIGIVGKDTLMETNKEFYEVLDLNVGKCKFALAALPSFKLDQGYNMKKIATKYPNIAREYFRKKGMDVELIKIEGSVELGPIVGLADAIVDIVETGNTLRENGLVVVEDICEISARMIVNKASMKTKKDEIIKIIENVSEVIRQ